MVEDRAYPLCRVCKNPCVAGQKDAHNKPAHLACQAKLPIDQRTPKLTKYPTPVEGY